MHHSHNQFLVTLYHCSYYFYYIWCRTTASLTYGTLLNFIHSIFGQGCVSCWLFAMIKRTVISHALFLRRSFIFHFTASFQVDFKEILGDPRVHSSRSVSRSSALALVSSGLAVSTILLMLFVSSATAVLATGGVEGGSHEPRAKLSKSFPNEYPVYFYYLQNYLHYLRLLSLLYPSWTIII